MENLTISEKVVEERPDLNPIPGHALVIFEQIGEGYEFQTVIRPGEDFRKKWRKKYFAYAVNTDQNLQLKFRDRILHEDQVHSFDITFIVDYCVSEPQRIAEVIQEDPLERLQNQIKRVIGRAISHVEWDRISSQKDFKDVEKEVLREGEPDDVDSITNLERIREFASDLGIKVKSIEFRRRLIEEDIAPDIAKNKAEIEKETLKVEHEMTVYKDSLEQVREKEKRKLKQEHESELMELEQENERKKQMQEGDMRILQAQTEAQVNFLKSASTAVQNVASEVSTGDDLLKASKSVQQALAGFMKEPRGSATTPELPAASQEIGGSLPAPKDEISEMLVETFNQVRQISGQPEEKRALLSAILHLLGELVLDDKADKKVVELHGERIKEFSARLRPDDEQLQFLSSLLKYDQIKEYLLRAVI